MSLDDDSRRAVLPSEFSYFLDDELRVWVVEVFFLDAVDILHDRLAEIPAVRKEVYDDGFGQNLVALGLNRAGTRRREFEAVVDFLTGVLLLARQLLNHGEVHDLVALAVGDARSSPE